MTIENLRQYCLQKNQVSEEFPFDNDTLVFKVLGKIFALVPLEKWEAGEPMISLKCDPDYAIKLREEYVAIEGAFHMNKKHWNSVDLTKGNMDRQKLFELVDHSYDMVVKKLSKKQQEGLKD